MVTINKKESIINATLSVVSKNGLVASPVSKVANEAGVSVGLIYRYFKNKEELVSSIYRDILNDVDLLFKDKIGDKTIKKTLKKRWSSAYFYLCNNPLKADFLSEYRVLNRVKKDSFELYEIENFFSKSKVKNELKKFDLELFSELLITSLITAYSLAKSKEMFERNMVEENIYNYFWDGIQG